MDWLDNYLDGLAQYKTTVSPSDTHIWGVKPNLNNQQKRMLFDAAAQSELEYRLIVQEARQAEINAGMGGSYDAGIAARERPATPAAPSGIPTATTNSIILQSGDPYNEGTYTKQSNGYFGDVGDSKLVWSGTRWEMLGDSSSLLYYNNKPNQTIDYFPDQGDWFNSINVSSPLIFVVGP